MAEYLLYPDETYVGDVYPYAVPRVADDADLVHSPLGSEWERVGGDDLNAEALGNAILAIFEGTRAAMDPTKISIDRLTPSNTAADVGELVAAEIWNAAMKAEEGALMTINADLFEANSIRADQIEAGVMNGQTIIGSEFRTVNGKLIFDKAGLRAFTSTNKLGVNITGEEASIVAGTFETPATYNSSGQRSWSEFGAAGLRVRGDDELRFVASNAYPLGAACWDPASETLQPISQFAFGPIFVEDDRFQDILYSRWGEGFVYHFTAPSSRMFMFLEFDCEFRGHYVNGNRGWPDFIWDLRDESENLVKTLWHKGDMAIGEQGLLHTYNLYPHYAVCQVADTVPGQLYKLTLWARKSMPNPVNTGEDETSKFGYARAVLFAT